MTRSVLTDQPDSYYGQTRDDVVAALARPLGRVLDVGCGSGGVGPGLRAAGAEELVGIELVPAAAARAEAIYDEVLVGGVEDALPGARGPFDTVLCLDVLEHMTQPELVLEQLGTKAHSGTQLMVSVPNARHVSLLGDLVVRGTFGYAEWGHRDRTHLSWFTGQDIADAVAQAGWADVRRLHPELGRSRQVDRLTRGLAAEFLTAQWWVGARWP